MKTYLNRKNTMSSKTWLPIIELPDDENQWCVFAKWIKLDHIPVLIMSSIGTIKEVKIQRKYDLDFRYTHFMLINPPRNES